MGSSDTTKNEEDDDGDDILNKTKWQKTITYREDKSPENFRKSIDNPFVSNSPSQTANGKTFDHCNFIQSLDSENTTITRCPSQPKS